jgi:hypothetical protein
MEAFLILVIEKFSSLEYSIFLTFLLIPTFCKSVYLKKRLLSLTFLHSILRTSDSIQTIISYAVKLNILNSS